MAPPDPRDAELVETAASAVARLVVAVHSGDHPAVVVELTRLLSAVTKYSNALAERPSDEALRRAVALLSTSR